MMRMLKLRFLILPLAHFCLVCFGGDSFVEKQTYMPPSEGRARFGSAPLDAAAFRKGTLKQRAAMAYSITQDKNLLGKSSTEIMNLLGRTDGHYWNGNIPAYFIHKSSDAPREAWQLVFLLDENNKVLEIKIHKNCCT